MGRPPVNYFADIYIMNMKEKQAAWLKQRKDEEEATFKIGRQRMVNHAHLNKQPPISKEPEFIQRCCPGCNNLLSIHGKLKKLIGKEFECSACGTHFIVLDPFPKKPGIISRTIKAIMEPLIEIHEQEKREREAGKLTSGEKLLGFAIGCWFGTKIGKKK